MALTSALIYWSMLIFHDLDTTIRTNIYTKFRKQRNYKIFKLSLQAKQNNQESQRTYNACNVGREGFVIRSTTGTSCGRGCGGNSCGGDCDCNCHCDCDCDRCGCVCSGNCGCSGKITFAEARHIAVKSNCLFAGKSDASLCSIKIQKRFVKKIESDQTKVTNFSRNLRKNLQRRSS